MRSEPKGDFASNEVPEYTVADLKHEIAQQRPFSSTAEEAMLNLFRTADYMHRAVQRATHRWGVTDTQYNVLRILRGAHPEGLTCSAIRERMITADPDITRLLGRLKALKLICQQRDKRDHRMVRTHIAPAGLELLAEMDPVIQKFPLEILGHLGDAQLQQLIRLLEEARSPCQEGPAAASCDGKSAPEERACSAATSSDRDRVVS